MSAIIKACLVGNSLINTGKECDISMVATSMLIAVPPTLKWTLNDLKDPIAWITPLLHAPKGQRVYPFFGIKAPINNLTNNSGTDLIVTLDDGTPVFMRYAMYTRNYETIAGGLCYAKALQGLNKSGYNIIEIDQQGQMLIGKNEDGSLRGLITVFMYSPAPKMADLKTNPYLNQFQLTYSPQELVQNGEIFSNAGQLLQLMGLIDSEIFKAAPATETTTEVAATRTITLTGVGADGDTIDIPGFEEDTILTAPVIKTGTETTVTLLATKVKNAINANTATSGYSATNAAGVITLIAPADLGAAPDGDDTAPTIVGTITATHTAYASGVTALGILRVGVQTDCAETDLVHLFGAALGSHADNFIVTEKESGDVVAPASAAIVSGWVELTGAYISGKTYNVIGAAPSVWLSNEVEGYDASETGVDIVVP